MSQHAYPGMVVWPDGAYSTLPPSRAAGGILVCPRTGENLCQWMWGDTFFSLYAFHPSTKFCPHFEESTWWNTVREMFPEPVMRRIFLYFCDEAAREGVL
jgi:hypothetical protein